MAVFQLLSQPISTSLNLFYIMYVRCSVNLKQIEYVQRSFKIPQFCPGLWFSGNCSQTWLQLDRNIYYLTARLMDETGD